MMAHAEMKIPDWLSALLPKIAEKLGKDMRKLNCEVSTPLQNLMHSDVFFVILRDVNETSYSKEDQGNVANLLIKKYPEGSIILDMNVCEQFQNEIVFYEKFSKHIRNCPRCIYIQKDPAPNTIIVLENMATRGMRPLRQRIDISYGYLIAALKAMAKFHANAYIMKERHSEEFFQALGKLQECKFTNEKSTENYKKFVNLTAPRSIRYLRKCDYDKEFCDKIEPLFQNAHADILCKAVIPAEPLATLCHGDFTINNVLCKEVEGGYDTVLIDFGMIRYSSPAIDLSTFLFLECPTEMRMEKLREFLRIYHDDLVKRLREAGIENLDRFSYEAFYDDFRRKAVFGFVRSTFFLGYRLKGYDVTQKDEITKLKAEQLAERNIKAGGEMVSKLLADSLLQLKDMGTFDEVLQKTK